MGKGLKLFREEIAGWLNKRFGITMCPDSEITATIGSKEAIAHFPLAYLNPGDLALIPDPCYPPYKSGTTFAGADFELMPLLKENDFFPDFSQISEASLKKAKIMFLNYPNNPTSACATPAFYKEAVAFYADYYKVLSEMKRVVSDWIIIVIGNRVLSRTLFDNASITTELFQSLGVSLYDYYKRENNKKRIPNLGGDGGGTNVEYILIFKKN